MNIFLCLSITCISSGEASIQIFSPFLKLDFHIIQSSLYVLDTCPLSDAFGKYFVLFYSLNGDFQEQFLKSNVTLFFFHGLCFLCCIQELSAKPKVTQISSHLRSLIHVEYIFVNGIKSVFRFFLCMQMSSCSSTTCGKDYPFYVKFSPLLEIS